MLNPVARLGFKISKIQIRNNDICICVFCQGRERSSKLISPFKRVAHIWALTGERKRRGWMVMYGRFDYTSHSSSKNHVMLLSNMRRKQFRSPKFVEALFK
jgi:hypothetical protein